MKKLLAALTVVLALSGVYAFMPAAKFAAVTYNVALDKSKVEWNASKKAGYHTGYYPLKSGSVVLDGNKLKGGKFVIDLANLKVTDGSGERLEGHLKSKDFFDVAAFGEATYEITSVNYTSDNTADVNGNLSLKGLSVPVRFQTQIRNDDTDGKGFFAEAFFTVDRHALGITWNPAGASKDVQIAVHLFAAK
jgi:polyisoprenoid-binding protein YceI